MISEVVKPGVLVELIIDYSIPSYLIGTKLTMRYNILHGRELWRYKIFLYDEYPMLYPELKPVSKKPNNKRKMYYNKPCPTNTIQVCQCERCANYHSWYVHD